MSYGTASAYTKKLLKEMRFALREFGRYNYYDKGPSEVMDIARIAGELKAMTASDARKVLVALRATDAGEVLAECLESAVDDADEAWLNEALPPATKEPRVGRAIETISGEEFLDSLKG
jgi:hypothetical protein